MGIVSKPGKKEGSVKIGSGLFAKKITETYLQLKFAYN
jgi:hypothetical protein